MKKVTHIALAVLALLAPTVGVCGQGAVSPQLNDVPSHVSQQKTDALLRFAKVRQGTKVVDLIPGDGYFTRAFAARVGARGHVYALVPKIFIKDHPEALTGIENIARALPDTVSAIAWMPFTALAEPVDIVWSSQSYHDVHNAPKGSVAAVNQAVFAMLKPGGLYVVVDHAAANGSEVSQTKTLHRIDEASVRQELAAAGFIYVSSSNALHNRADPRTAYVSDASIKGRTDRFALLFRKPN